MKDPIEVLAPSRNCIFVCLRVEDSRDRMSLALVDDLPLDLGYSPAVEILVSELLDVDIAGSTHIVSCSIAPGRDLLRSSSRLPPKPRLRALHTSAQATPRST